MRTSGVKRLVEQALGSLPKPHTEDVIDDVFHAIEHRPEWRQEYEDLCTDLGKTVVNTWGGFWISNHEGRSSLQQVPSKKSTLIGSYSQLTTVTAKAKPEISRKRKESEALQLMSAYFQEHKGQLPTNVRKHRELIVELLMAGLPAEEAFSMVLANAR
jgi:hypothetical protein